MSIPEEMITKVLNLLATQSDPGDCMHHLYTIAGPSAPGALGVPDPDSLSHGVWALAPVFEDSPAASDKTRDFLIAAITRITRQYAEAGERVLFAAIGQEAWLVDRGAFDAEARALQAQGRLSEHPAAAEVTFLYAACRDGRRWRGRRYLTGPNAGRPVDLDLLVGPPDPREFFGMEEAGLLQGMVGLLAGKRNGG